MCEVWITVYLFLFKSYDPLYFFFTSAFVPLSATSTSGMDHYNWASFLSCLQIPKLSLVQFQAELLACFLVISWTSTHFVKNKMLFICLNAFLSHLSKEVSIICSSPQENVGKGKEFQNPMSIAFFFHFCMVFFACILPSYWLELAPKTDRE